MKNGLDHLTFFEENRLSYVLTLRCLLLRPAATSILLRTHLPQDPDIVICLYSTFIIMFSKSLVTRRTNQMVKLKCTGSAYSTASPSTSDTVATDQQENDKQGSFNYTAIRNEIMDYWMKNEAASPQGTSTNARYCCFTLHDAQQSYLKKDANWHWLDRELSSNYAGETGAVHIYKGAICALSLRPTDPASMEFCTTHMATESEHLAMFEKIVPKGKRTILIPIWKMAGWTLGFLPTMIGGSKALYVTVEAVESFVEEHFHEQIDPLTKEDACPELVKLLKHCCEDEVHHKEDAANQLLKANENLDSWWIKPWSQIVTVGSKVAAEMARRV